MEIGPVLNIRNEADATIAAKVVQTQLPPARFRLLNGSTTSGITMKVQESLLKQFPNMEVVDRDNAKSSTYKNSLLVDMKGNLGTVAETIAKALNITIASIPPEEATSGAGYDFLLIVGNDWK